MHSPALQQPGGKTQPDRGVVVAAGQDHACPCLRDPHKGIIQQLDHVQPRQRAIVDVSGNQDDIHGFRFHQRYQLVHEVALGIKHANAVE